jgi:hypothetical protein
LPKPNYYSIIPADVRYDEELPSSAKIIFSELTIHCNEDGYCKIHKDKISHKLNMNPTSFNRNLKKLLNKTYLEKIKLPLFKKYKEAAAEIIKTKCLYNLGYGEKTCNWCKTRTTILHDHYYLLPQKKGGEETIKICSNCHAEFHKIVSNLFMVKIKDTETIKKAIELRGETLA